MTFSYTTNVRAHAGVTLQKIKTNKLNQNNVCHVPFTMFVRFFYMPFLYVLSTSSFFYVPFLYVLSSWLFVTLFVFCVPFPYVLSTCVFVCFAKAFPIRSV